MRSSAPFSALLGRARGWFSAFSSTPEGGTDPEGEAEIEAYLVERRAEMCRWLLVARAGSALGLAGYLALNALLTAAAWPAAALATAFAYAAGNGAICLGRTYLLGDAQGRRPMAWAYAALDVAAVVAFYVLLDGAVAGALAPSVVLVGLLVLVLLVYTLLGYPLLSTSLALVSLGIAAAAFYVFPEGAAMPAGTEETPLRTYLLVEYLSIACLVTCLLALRLRDRIAAHRTELHHRLRARVEADLESERRRQVEALGHLKRDFIKVLSHELRNPVAPLVSSLEVVQEDAAEGHCNEGLVSVAARSAHQLRCLVDDYTRLAQLLTRPGDDLMRHNVPLAPIAEAVTERLAERLAEQPNPQQPQRVPRFALEALDRHAVAADPALLGAALHALLLRAARYTCSDAPVTVRGFAERDETGFTVHDPGSHLDNDTLGALSDDLFASTDERLYGREATGLELLLARHALRRLGGRLGVESSEQGTTVRCTLPPASDTHETVSAEYVRRLIHQNPLGKAAGAAA